MQVNMLWFVYRSDGAAGLKDKSMARPNTTYRFARRNVAKLERRTAPRRTRGNVIDSITRDVRVSHYITRMSISDYVAIDNAFPSRALGWMR
jgi:hypothetical protein